MKPNHQYRRLPGIIVFFIILLTGVGSVEAQTDTVQTNVPALKDVYAHDFYIGCILSYRNIGLPGDPPVPGQSAVVTPQGGYLIKYHMNSMSPGNNMKPQYTIDIAGSAAAYNAALPGPVRDSIETHPIVRFNGDMIAQLNWAQRQGFTFRGHTLVWHNQTPSAFFYSGYSTANVRLTKDVMIERMDNYFHEIFRLIHEGWPGVLSAIDIVNEAIDDGTDRVRTSGNDWYTTFGDTTYVMKAFELARKYSVQFGETQIKLYYNDYNTDIPAKADGIVRLLTPVFQAGNLDGIGMQEHDNLAFPTAQSFISTYNKFFPICTEMAVTEMDVATGTAPPSAAVLATQADQYTFVANQSTSLWDLHNQCKPAFFAVAGVGMAYEGLDSLLIATSGYNASGYTTDSWARFAGARASALNTIETNYSVPVSADTALSAARDSLTVAVDDLVRLTNGIANTPGDIPTRFELRQNYPNPFNPSTTIRYDLPERSVVEIRIYDIIGRVVATLVDAVQDANKYIIEWNPGNLGSGVYFLHIDARSEDNSARYSSIRKLLFLK